MGSSQYSEVIPGAPLKNTKPKKEKVERVYVLGSADPAVLVREAEERLQKDFEQHQGENPYNFMSGCDYKIHVDGEQFNLAQAISVSMHRCRLEVEGKETKEIRGSLIIVGGPGMEVIKEFLDKDECQIKAEAKDEFGHVEVSFNEKVRLDGWAWGVSIDDIVTETTVEFTVL